MAFLNDIDDGSNANIKDFTKGSSGLVPAPKDGDENKALFGSGKFEEIMTHLPFKFGIDSSGNYGFIKDGADTVTPFKSQTDIDNAYNNGYSSGRSQGQTDVMNTPSAYNLYNKSQYDSYGSSMYTQGQNSRPSKGSEGWATSAGTNSTGPYVIFPEGYYNNSPRIYMTQDQANSLVSPYRTTTGYVSSTGFTGGNFGKGYVLFPYGYYPSLTNSSGNYTGNARLYIERDDVKNLANRLALLFNPNIIFNEFFYDGSSKTSTYTVTNSDVNYRDKALVIAIAGNYDGSTRPTPNISYSPTPKVTPYTLINNSAGTPGNAYFSMQIDEVTMESGMTITAWMAWVGAMIIIKA